MTVVAADLPLPADIAERAPDHPVHLGLPVDGAALRLPLAGIGSIRLDPGVAADLGLLPARPAPPMFPGGGFLLLDHDGRMVSEATFRGRYALVTFASTRCRGPGARTLGKLSRVLAAFGPKMARLQALCITLDPERDTPAALRGFLRAKHPRFLGLTGTPEQVDAARAAFRILRPCATGDAAHVLPEAGWTVLLDPSGGYAAHFPDTTEEYRMAERLEACLGRARPLPGTR